MDSELLNSYLNNIGELVIDEDKIVTYKFLSKTLGIHVNTAKQLLFTYLTRQKSESSPSISATYLLAGKLKDGSFKVTVVNKNELKTSYEKFAEITSEHIYSIQKGKELKNIQILCGIGKDIQNNKSVIKCSKSVIKSKNNKKKNVEVLIESEIKIKTFDEKKDKLNKISPKKSEEVSEHLKKSPKKSKENERKNQETLNKVKGNIANFFENATQKTLLKSSNIEKITTDFVNNKKQATDSTSGSLTVSATNLLPEPKNQNEEESNSIRNDKKKNLNKKKSENKRKRIQLFSDSEDSSNSDKDESIAEEEPAEISLPAAILEDDKEEIEEKPQNKRKRRKIVDKTIMNKDGYLETKKEVIFETDSDMEPDEEDALSKTGGNEKKKTKLDQVTEKKISTKNAAKKQSSLLTFFRKG